MNTDLTRFSEKIGQHHLMPLWERAPRAKPGSSCVPMIWRYAEMRPLLMRAVELIDHRNAERRVLVLENPSLRGTTYITRSLFAGLQVIMPGEVAPSHRHTPNALRFIVEGEGAYTAVAGERVPMVPGDFVVTPGWVWHDHGNPGSEAVVWMDGLDTPFAQFFDAIFREDYPQESHPVCRADGHATAAYGSNLLPVDYRPEGLASPVLRYPYERTRDALEHLARDGPAHPAHGLRLRYANPATGRHPFPTMAVFMRWLPQGFSGTSCRSTDGAVFNVVEGHGVVEVGAERYSFAPHDVFVVPPWCPHRFVADVDCVLFSFSDRAGQEALGFWREEWSQDG
jgi:gentisate 1,2-dioxygenase